MNQEIIRAVNIGLLSFCSVLAVVLLMCFRRKSMHVRSTRILFNTIAVMFFSMVLHTISLIYDSASHYVLSTTALAISYFCVYTVYYLYVLYITEQINQMEREERVSRSVTYVSLILFVLGAVFWAFSLFAIKASGMLQAVLSLGSSFAVGNAGSLILIAISLVLIIRHHNALGVKQAALLSSMPALMLALTYLEPLANGIEIRYPAIMLEIVIIYSQHYLGIENREKSAENDEIRLRLNVATDRMKPHYLYNVLTTIYYLCETDPKKAQYAIGLFAEYMRTTLQTMENRELVAFSRELTEIEQYLSLEKIRFGDRLNIEIDVECDDFMVPLLSIQPLVENAVKHGISPKEEGGTVRVMTRRISGGGAQIIVSDDGAGFDTEKLKELDKSHEGLANVRERIRLKIGGDMTISSEPGKGTTAIVTIWPYRSDGNNN